MAEFVQHTLEEMINEVEQLQRVGLFDHGEIKKIIRKRKQHEYKLRRKVKSKEDYMAYIQYEIRLLSLIALRRQQEGYNHKKAEIEGKIIQRILILFNICCKKWPTTAAVWISRIKFVHLKMKNPSYASQLFNRMLQIITNKPNLWLLAAKFEFENVYSIESARHVLQQGISFNKTSRVLWHEYFRLELLFVDFILRRRELKKLNALGVVRIPKYIEEEEVRDVVLKGKVAAAVYKHARLANPDDEQLAIGFLDIVKHFTWADEVEDAIFDDLFACFGNDTRVWLAKADRLLHRSNSLDAGGMTPPMEEVERKVNSLLRLMLKRLDTAESWSVYLNVQLQMYSLYPTDDRLSRFFDILEFVDHRGHLTEEWFLKWAELLAQYRGSAETLHLYETRSKKFTKSSNVWCSYLKYVIAIGSTNEKCLDVFSQARSLISPKMSLPLWTLIIDLSIGRALDDTVEQSFESAIVGPGDVAGPIKERYLDWAIVTKQSLSFIRKLYKRLKQQSPVPFGLHDSYIRFESAQLKPDLERLRRAYAHMLKDSGTTEVDAWLKAIRLERQAGEIAKAGTLYSQAVKSLIGDKVQLFINQHTLISIGKS